jgi:hypothetical protein
VIEALSVVSFDNPARVPYLERSFRAFHRYYPGARHVVMDGSERMGAQEEIYRGLGVEFHHRPTAFSERLKFGLGRLRQDYFVFLPDDFNWIFDFPLAAAIEECGRHGIDELKLTCRGMPWFSRPNPVPETWFHGDRVISGERLVRRGDLFVSERTLFRDFHEQFSLACNLIRRGFLEALARRMPDDLPSPGAVEKWAYLRLYLKLNRYSVAYYKMWIPAFHFIDLTVEGRAQAHKADDMLIDENFDLYNGLYNGRKAP